MFVDVIIVEGEKWWKTNVFRLLFTMRICLLLQDHILNKNCFRIATCFFSTITVLLFFLIGHVLSQFRVSTCFFNYQSFTRTTTFSCWFLSDVGSNFSGHCGCLGACLWPLWFARDGGVEMGWDTQLRGGEKCWLSYYPNWSSDVAMEKIIYRLFE